MKKDVNYKNESFTLPVPFVVRKTKNGYTAECLDLNIITQGKTLNKTRKNITEAINLHLKSAAELGILDNELEKLGITRKNNKLEIPNSELLKAPIKIPTYS
ncbi:MAG TPA: type II toxin-antitoxin system HicB family antitoxin [Candidatus Nanoarchaeia archaeon]|nr:type II toxin-antitoxin system HicB family antitoxin [Candidatus Nanoarchaeia archaeon]